MRPLGWRPSSNNVVAAGWPHSHPVSTGYHSRNLRAAREHMLTSGWIVGRSGYSLMRCKSGVRRTESGVVSRKREPSFFSSDASCDQPDPPKQFTSHIKQVSVSIGSIIASRDLRTAPSTLLFLSYISHYLTIYCFRSPGPALTTCG